MTALSAARAELAGLLEAGLAAAEVAAAVYSEVPEALEPPCVVIQPAPDYVTASDTFEAAEHLVTLEVYLLVPLNSNAQAAEDLDRLLEALLAGLFAGEWWVTRIGQPGPQQTAGWVAHGAPVTLSTTVQLHP